VLLLEEIMKIFTFSSKQDDFHMGIETYQFVAASPEHAQRMAKEHQWMHNRSPHIQRGINPPLNIDFQFFTQSPLIEGFLDPDLAETISC
jgi:hypothetical protein